MTACYSRSGSGENQSGYGDSNPGHVAWEATVLPLNYTRDEVIIAQAHFPSSPAARRPSEAIYRAAARIKSAHLMTDERFIPPVWEEFSLYYTKRWEPL